MAESLIQVTEGSGKKLHTNSRSVGGNTVEDEVTVAGLPYLPCYNVVFNGISIAAGTSHVLQIMAPASLNLYIVGIRVFQAANATTAAYCEWSVRRLTTAGTGGGSVTPTQLDQTDASAGSAGMTLPGVKGTEGTVPLRFATYLTQTPGAAGVDHGPIIDWNAWGSGLAKPIRIGSGITQGIALRNETAIAGATVTGYVTILETAL